MKNNPPKKTLYLLHAVSLDGSSCYNITHQLSFNEEELKEMADILNATLDRFDDYKFIVTPFSPNDNK